METTEIEKLAQLARLDLRSDEIERFRGELSSVLEYVAHVREVTDGDEGKATDIGDVHNVLREDGEPHQVGVYTDRLLDEATDAQDGYVKVKKIL